MSTLKPTEGARPSEVERPPEELSGRLSTHEERAYWFPTWVRSGKNWATVEYKEILEKNKKDNSVGVLEWCTLGQAIHIYRSEVVGRALCDEAGKDLRTTRRHPLVPLLDEARQFKVPTPLDMKQIH